MADVLGFERSTRIPFSPIPRRTLGAKRLAGYFAAVALVALAVVLAVVVQHLVATPNITLVFVLPVVIVAVAFGFVPAMATAILSVLAFDFFFAPPLYSLRIYNASDAWAAGLLLVIAAIVSSVAAEARRRAVEARREADRANALHDLAHLVVAAAPSAEVSQATANALSKIFQAPAAVLIDRGGKVEPAALAADADLSPADLEAANWSLANKMTSHADAYPFADSTFDFWPIQRDGAPGVVLGVRHGDSDARPEQPANYVDLAGAYLAASLAAPARPARA